MNQTWIQYTTQPTPKNVIDVPWEVAAATTARETQATPQALAPAAPLTRPTLLEWLYSAPTTRLDTPVAADLDLGIVLICVAQTLQRPVAWVEPMAQVGRFVQTAYAPIESPDPDLIVALLPNTGAFQAALRRFQTVRMKPPRGHWDKWYQTLMAAARDLVAPLQALQPTASEALFVLRWAALVASAGCQNSIVDY